MYRLLLGAGQGAEVGITRNRPPRSRKARSRRITRPELPLSVSEEGDGRGQPVVDLGQGIDMHPCDLDLAIEGRPVLEQGLDSRLGRHRAATLLGGLSFEPLLHHARAYSPPAWPDVRPSRGIRVLALPCPGVRTRACSSARPRVGKTGVRGFRRLSGPLRREPEHRTSKLTSA